jgi:hypothetical protein
MQITHMKDELFPHLPSMSITRIIGKRKPSSLYPRLYSSPLFNLKPNVNEICFGSSDDFVSNWHFLEMINF